MRLLLVEDDTKTASFIQKGLRESGYLVDRTDNGEDGYRMASTQTYDLAIVDIMLPRCDGLSLIQAMRQNSINVPVVILSAKRSVDDRVAGLQQGGDDYLTKPFAFSELLARIQAISRRGTNAPEPTVLSLSDLRMDLLKRAVTRNGVRIELQPREFSLLEYLLRNPSRVVSKTMITQHVWDYSFDPQTNVVEARICRLRDKIDRGFKSRLIHTIRGVGYVLREDA